MNALRTSPHHTTAPHASLQALGHERYMQLYRGRFTHFNPIQTQVRVCACAFCVRFSLSLSLCVCM
jgi:hypothetical protein